MPDYGHDLLLGALLDPADRMSVIPLAELVERVGLDVVSLSDHPYQPERLDTLALLSYLAARTRRVRIVPDLLNLPLRSPTVVARTATTLDVLSRGRFELGLAPGAQQLWTEITGDGGPKRDAGESIDALEEAVQIIRALWRPGPDLSFEGRYYSVPKARTGPAPAHEMEIWLGAYQPRMTRLVGRIGDGIVPSAPFFPPERWPAVNAIVDEAAAATGRAPAAVRRVYNIDGGFSAAGTGFPQGPPAVWVERLTELTLTSGVSCYLLYRAQDPDVIRRFAAEVAPALRQNVATARAGGPRSVPSP